MPYINPHTDSYLAAKEILAGSERVKEKLIVHRDRTEYRLRFSPLPKGFRQLTAFQGALLANKGKNRHGGIDYSMRASQINDWVEFTGTFYTKSLEKVRGGC
ncbi:hypothetical protein [Aeromonas hydrophila]|uniref:hypothetical protein n=1 Tax=Aeromonas hydrophila TaxID=644 RepID=UPI00080AAD79|nr:hypothetical protein [Aeromonas hydrophila]ANT70198.1 hypothetical protein TK34_22235 [Aeromonas hydrophila]